MAIEFTPDEIVSGFNLTKLNNNFNKTQIALQDALSRSGKGPNQMEADIDLNSNDLLNVGTIEAELLVVDGVAVQPVDLASALKISNALSELPAAGLDDEARENLGLTDLYNRAKEEINILDYATSDAQRASIKAGTTTINAVWNLATADAIARGIKTIRIPSGSYEMDLNTSLVNPGVYVKGDAVGTVINKNGSGRGFETVGNAPQTSTDGFLLTANSSADGLTVTVSPANAANFVAGTRAILWHNFATGGSREAEFVWITDVNTGTGVITFAAPIYFSYLTANGAKLFNVSLIENVGYENLIIDWTDGTQTSPQRPPFRIDEVFVAWFCLRPRFMNVITLNTINETISLHGCVDAYVENVHGINGKSDNVDLLNAFSYGIHEQGVNVGLVAKGLQFERHRHGYTTGAPDVTMPSMFNGGHTFWPKISDSIHRWAKAAGWDTHDIGIGVTFENLQTIGAIGAGFQIRSRRARVLNCFAYGIMLNSGTQGHGLFLVGGDAAGLWASDTEVTGFSALKCAGAGIRDQSPGTIANLLRFEDLQGPAIHADGSASGDGEYNNGYAKDISKNPAIGGQYGLVFGNASAQKNPRFRDWFIDDPNNNLLSLVRRNNTATDKPEITNVRGLNSTKQPIDVYIDPTSTSNTTIRGGFGPSGFGVGDIVATTIVSDSVNVNLQRSAGILLVPEAGAADALVTLTGGERDSIVVLWGSTGNTITLTHGVGTDNLVLKGAVNTNILANQNMGLMRRGAVWIELWRNF